jgi:phosphate transport system substrate-binding protein
LRAVTRRGPALIGAIVAAGLLVSGCGGSTEASTPEGSSPAGQSVTGSVKVSGSSTVQPISTAVAEAFEDDHDGVEITVDGPGTGDGFKLFCQGETDISDASRPIKKEEADACAEAGIEYIELKVAFDGLTVMTNPANTAAECLNFNDLYALVGPESQGFAKWSDAGNLARELGSSTTFPDAPLEITAPGTESGTYDAFYEIALEKKAKARAEEGKIEKDAKGGPKQKVRPDYSSQANDNAIMQAIQGSNSSFGWVGFAFAEEAGDKVKEIAIDGGKGCVAPALETIADGTYPLSRALYIYVSKNKLDANPALQAYVDFYTADGLDQVEEVGYVSLPQDQIDAMRSVWEAKTTGTRDGGK